MIGLLATKAQTLVSKILELTVVEALGTAISGDKVSVWEVCN